MSELDKVDTHILSILQENGRQSNSKVANQLSLSETPCWRRIKRLEEQGFIDGYQANLNRKRLGFGVMAFVQLSYTEHDNKTTENFERVILECDNVLACHNITGDADFLLQVVAKDLDDYSRFIDNVIRKLSGVSSIRSNISLKEIKASSKMPLEF